LSAGPPAATATRTLWQDAVYEVLRANDYTQFAYVPDAGHQRLIERAQDDEGAFAIPLSNEGEGVGIMTGAYLGGSRGVLLTQSGGVGNCVNYLSLVRHCSIPFLMVVTMRGDQGEQNPWQYPMGQAVEPVLAAMGVQTLRVDDPEQAVPTVEIAVGAVARANRAIAVLLTQRLLGVKKF
jgi:sulfopyruvate decarboxylase alpha subunit